MSGESGLIKRLLGDREFYSAVLRVAVPIATQQFFMNALNAVDVLMVGQLGETSLAGVGLANQITFLMALYLFGVGSGSAIFSAQYWGKGDVTSLRQVLGLALRLAVGGALLFSLAALLVPRQVISFYTGDPLVQALGGRYLQIIGLSYVPMAVTVMFGIVLRSTRQVKIPMAVSVTALSLKTVLAYGLIFGRFGLPALGVIGAAYATVIARVLECALMLALSYGLHLPTAARLTEMTGLSREFLGRFARTVAPVVVGEIIWSFGITTYMAIYARIGTDSLAAVSIAGTIEGIALVPFLGLGNACAILLGNRIGAGDTATAGLTARRFVLLAMLGALVMGGLILVASGPILGYYRISAASQGYVRGVLMVMAGALWLKAANLTMIVGILRSGGDTRFALFADTAPLWFIGVPMALLGAFVLHLPVYWVVLMVMSDEAAKCIISLWRVLSGRWINNVVTW